MTRDQRVRCEMFHRVCDFGKTHRDILPEASVGGQALTRVASALATIDEQATRHVVARAEGGRVKAETRRAVLDDLKTIAMAARRVTKTDAGASPFRILNRQRSTQAVLATGRAFLEEAAKRGDAFVALGLAPGFLGEFQGLVERLEAAENQQLSGKTRQREAKAGVAAALEAGFDAVLDLDVVVAGVTRHNPVLLAAWEAARRIESRHSSSKNPGKTPESGAKPARIDAA